MSQEQQQQTIDLDAVPKEDILRSKAKHVFAIELEVHELAGLAKDRAKLEREGKVLEQRFAEVKAEWKEKLERHQREIDRVATDIDRGKQDCLVLCTEVVRGSIVLIVDEKTGIVHNTRPLSIHEAQQKMPAVEGGSGVLAQAAAAQKANNSQEDDEGDVVPDDGFDELGAKRRRKK